jgi:cytochrome P450
MTLSEPEKHIRLVPEPLSKEFFADPPKTYEWLRANDPVVPVEVPGGGRAWLVTRYDDVRAGLSDPRLSNVQARLAMSTPFDALPPALRAATVRDVQNLDPPEQTRLRRLISAPFSAQSAARHRPRLTALAQELIDGFADGVTDLVADYAAPFAGRALAELLGVPAEDHPVFQSLSNAVVNAIHGGEPEALAAPATELHGRIRELLAAKAAAPADDLLTTLLHAREQGTLTDDELTSTVFGLLNAGQEGTTNLIGNGLHLLLTHPAELDRLRADPSLLPFAIEEFARLTAPLDLPIFRSCPVAIELGGVTVPANEPIMFSLQSSGRDETRFPRPEQLDIRRANKSHLAFGHGAHFCPGAPFGRVQAQIAIGELLARTEPRLAVRPGEIRPRASVVTRGLTALPVHLR